MLALITTYSDMYKHFIEDNNSDNFFDSQILDNYFEYYFLTWKGMLEVILLSVLIYLIYQLCIKLEI